MVSSIEYVRLAPEVFLPPASGFLPLEMLWKVH